MTTYDAVIIGGGLGGLLCGNILSREGMNVCVVEKNHKLGGSLQTFGRKGSIFNTGLNYTESLDDGQVLNQYFRYFGLIDKIKLRRLDENGFERIHFNNGEYRFAMGREAFIETLSQQFPHENKGLQKYTENINNICRAIPLYTFSGAPSNIIDNSNLSTGAASFIRSVINDPRLQNIVAGNNMLYSGTENRTPLYIHALINNSFIESAWRIADGSHNLVNALAANIIQNGGTILKNSRVDKIVTRNGMAESAVLQNNEIISGRNFIVNIHPSELLKLIDPDALRKTYRIRINNLEDTMGMFTLYLVFKKNTVPYMNYNFYHFNQDNVWVASDYRPNSWPQNYLLMPVAMSDNTTFARSASVITYMHYSELKKWENTYTGDRGDEYLEFKNQKAGQLLHAVEQQFPGISKNVEAFYTSTPLTWRDYTGTRRGSAYGLTKDYNRPLESLVLPRTHVPNLFLTGQNNYVHGILGVTISSVVTCSELIDESFLVKKIRSS